MAIITRIKCDRCGGEAVEGPKASIYTGVIVHISSTSHKDGIEMDVDLCADCYEGLISRTKSFLNISEDIPEDIPPETAT